MELEEFYDEYVGKVYKFFYLKSLDRMLAEDLTSHTFISFMEKADDISVNKRKQYLYGIMRNVWIEFLKQKYKESIATLEEIEDFAVYSEGEVADFEKAATVDQRLRGFVARLPTSQCKVVTLRYISGLSVRQVADELKKDKNYVKVTQRRGLHNLRQMLKEPYMDVHYE